MTLEQLVKIAIDTVNAFHLAVIKVEPVEDVVKVCMCVLSYMSNGINVQQIDYVQFA